MKMDEYELDLIEAVENTSMFEKVDNLKMSLWMQK